MRKLRKPLEHGGHGYKHGCRCSICRAYVNKKTRESHLRHPEVARNWRRAHPEKDRERAWQRLGIDMTSWSWKQYCAMLEVQHGSCACCEVQLTTSQQRGNTMSLAHVDHDHITGKVRSILCGGCNMAAGNLQDDPVRADKLAIYLRTIQRV